jgi:hypothetical protein
VGFRDLITCRDACLWVTRELLAYHQERLFLRRRAADLDLFVAEGLERRRQLYQGFVRMYGSSVAEEGAIQGVTFSSETETGKTVVGVEAAMDTS